MVDWSVGAANSQHPPGSPLFACKEISHDLGGREILKDISLQVASGEVLGVIGPNGAGKTSLFEVLCGRFPAKSGTVTFKGQDVSALPLYQRARIGIGRTYQTPVVPDELTVAEVFKAARQAYKPYLNRWHVLWAMRLVRFSADPDMPAVQLDTLDRRKLLLSCLIMRRPPLLLMDEPAAGLINSEVDDFDDLIRVLAKELNIAIVIVEHRIELLDTIADRVMVMDAGEKISEGDLGMVLKDPRVRAAYFEDVH